MPRTPRSPMVLRQRVITRILFAASTRSFLLIGLGDKVSQVAELKALAHSQAIVIIRRKPKGHQSKGGISTCFGDMDGARQATDKSPSLVKIKVFFTCFHSFQGQYFQITKPEKQGLVDEINICAQQSFLFPQKGCWLPSEMLFWRMPDTGSYQCLRLKLRLQSFMPATSAPL